MKAKYKASIGEQHILLLLYMAITQARHLLDEKNKL